MTLTWERANPGELTNPGFCQTGSQQICKGDTAHLELSGPLNCRFLYNVTQQMDFFF